MNMYDDDIDCDSVLEGMLVALLVVAFVAFTFVVTTGTISI